MRIWATGRSVHLSRVDCNLMAVAEREKSSLPLYLPIVCQSSRDSIRQPPDCELILSLSGYCQPTAYCYCCHFSVVWHENLPAYCSYAEPELYTVCVLLLILFFLIDKKRLPGMCTHRSMWTLFFDTHTVAWLCFSIACRPPVPSVIHEPSAWASAVSDVCQTGPHLSPLFIF